jgi:hypothetical protein
MDDQGLSNAYQWLTQRPLSAVGDWEALSWAPLVPHGQPNTGARVLVLVDASREA